MMGGLKRGLNYVNVSSYTIDPYKGDSEMCIENLFNILCALYLKYT